MTQSIDSKILTKMQKCGRGSAFFSADFIPFGESKSIAKALERLTNSGKIIRVARGIYCFPKIDKVLGLGIIYPSLEEIAQSIAKRDKAKIAPTGDYALNRLGLSTQVPTNIVFLTDGSPRKIKVYDKFYITFRRVAPKKLLFRNEIIMLVVFALKEIGESNITNEQYDKIRSIVSQIPIGLINEDKALIPVWIRRVIDKCYE
ncbi:MAG: DUF6088 family protein [bacterium]